MKSLAELKAIRDKTRASVTLRENAEAGTRVMVGMATCGIAAGRAPCAQRLCGGGRQARTCQDVTVTQTGCIGICQYEPVVEVLRARPGEGHLCEDDPGKGCCAL